MNKMFRYVRSGALAVGSAALSVAAFAQTSTLPDATAQIGEITTKQGSYATVMFALALAAVGILVGVKWIKRGRGAA